MNWQFSFQTLKFKSVEACSIKENSRESGSDYNLIKDIKNHFHSKIDINGVITK